MNEHQSTLIYLACPYSHPDLSVRQMRHMVVNRIAFELHRQGKFVYSPLTHNIPLIQFCNEMGRWNVWERFDKFMLMKCNQLIVVTIDGWKDSKGVTAEIQLAQELNMPIEFLEPQTIINLQDKFLTLAYEKE